MNALSPSSRSQLPGLWRSKRRLHHRPAKPTLGLSPLPVLGPSSRKVCSLVEHGRCSAAEPSANGPYTPRPRRRGHSSARGDFTYRLRRFDLQPHNSCLLGGASRRGNPSGAGRAMGWDRFPLDCRRGRPFPNDRGFLGGVPSAGGSDPGCRWGIL